MKKLTEEWIAKAEQDYLVTIREFKSDPPALETSSFHAQQCIEKYLKAVLQENEVEFEKIHDPDILREQCVNFIPELKDYRDVLIKLSTYAIEVRYPGLDVTKEEAVKCIEIMEEVRKVIRRYFVIP